MHTTCQSPKYGPALCHANAQALSTRCTYGVGTWSYSEFCRHYHQNPLPPSEQLLICFLTSRATAIAWKTAQVYLSGIRMLCIEYGFIHPFWDLDLMRLTLQVLRWKSGKQPKRTLQPITPALLLRLKRALRHDSVLLPHDQAML